jgi:histone H3/H4
MIPESMKKQLKPDDFDFLPETSKEWQDKAVSNIKADRAGVVKKIQEADSISGGTQAHEAALLTKEMVDKGDVKGLTEWIPVVAEKTRETARALKGTDTAWDKGPAGALVKAQRILDDAVPKELKAAVKKEIKETKPALEAMNKVNQDNVEAVFKDFLGEKPKVSKAVREWLDKQEIEAKQRVKDYFKPSDGVIKLHAGPPGEILTDLAKIGAAKLARKTLDFAEWSAEMIKEFGERVKPYLKQIYDDSVKLIKSKSLKTKENVSIDKAIRQVMAQNGVKIQDIARKHVSVIDETGQTLAQKFIRQAGLSKDAADKVEKIFVSRMKELTTAKKQQILDQMFKTRKPSQRKALSDKIIELSNMGAIGDSKYAKVLNEKYGIPELNADDVKKIIKQADEIQGMTDVFKRQAAVNKMMGEIQSKIPASFGAKVKSYTMINTLLNPKTIGSRNILGNVSQAMAMRVNKAFMSGIDFAASKLKGTDRKITFRTGRGLGNVFKDFFSDVKTGAKAGWEGYNPYGTLSEFKMASQSFTGKYNPLTYMEKALGAALSGAGDYPFYMKAVMDSIGEQSVLKAMNEGLKGTELKNAAKKYADEVINSAKNISDFSKTVLDTANRAGEKATFRDANIISSVLQGIHDTFNVVGIGTHKPTVGKLATREFGLGDIVIMFAKTPGALLNIGLEYSPLGVAKSLLEMGTGITKASREKVIESITKAVSGTLLLSGTGYYLTSKGAMTGKAPSDKEARNFFDENGRKEYSFNTDAIVRWVKNGFKDEELKPKDGDKWYTYDWFAPFSFNVGLGANVAQEGLKLNTLKAIPDTLGAGMKMFAESDTMSNLLSNNYQDIGDKALQTLVSLPSRFVPLGSIINQVKQMTDNTKRDVSSDDPWQKTLNLLKNRVPGLSKELPAVLTTTGEEKEMYAGGSNNPLNVLLSPGYLGIYKKSPGRDLLINLYKSTGKTSQFPKLQTNTIKIYNTEYTLTRDQKADLQKYVGQMTWSTLDNLVTAKSDKGKKFDDLPDETKLKVISNLMEEIGNKAEEYMAKKMNIKEPTKTEERKRLKANETPKFKLRSD